MTEMTTQPTDTLPTLPPGYEWTHEPGERAPSIATPFGATLTGCFGADVGTTIANRAEAAWQSHLWLEQHGAETCVPEGVDHALWWLFVSRADASIYPHLLSHVAVAGEWQLFEIAGLTRGAMAVYTDAARRGLRLAAGSLSGKHDAVWMTF